MACRQIIRLVKPLVNIDRSTVGSCRRRRHRRVSIKILSTLLPLPPVVSPVFAFRTLKIINDPGGAKKKVATVNLSEAPEDASTIIISKCGKCNARVTTYGKRNPARARAGEEFPMNANRDTEYSFDLLLFPLPSPFAICQADDEREQNAA